MTALKEMEPVGRIIETLFNWRQPLTLKECDLILDTVKNVLRWKAMNNDGDIKKEKLTPFALHGFYEG